MQYLANGELTLAGLNALSPRVTKVRVPGISTFVEPSATASATTAFAGVVDGAALGAHAIDYRHGWCSPHARCGGLWRVCISTDGYQ